MKTSLNAEPDNPASLRTSKRLSASCISDEHSKTNSPARSRHVRPVSAQHVITISDIQESYRRYAKRYDWLFGAVLNDGRRKVLREVAALQPKHILEVGVGTGLLLDGYPRDSEVIGVDVSADMLDIARARIATLALRNTRVELADGERLAYADGAFDCVVLPYVLSVTPSPATLVAEAIRVCAPQGRIVIVNHFSGSKFWHGFEALAAPLAARIGFHSAFSYEENVLAHPWRLEKKLSANWMGLSQVVVLIPDEKNS